MHILFSQSDFVKTFQGIHNSTDVSKEEFLSALYDNQVVVKKQVRLKRDLKKFKFLTIAETKKAINAIYYKMNVSDDFISCKPFQ